MLGSKLEMGLFVLLRAKSHDALQTPDPHGSRWRTPVDPNQSSTSTPWFPSSDVDGGVTTLDRPKTVENIGVNALLLSFTRSVSTPIPRRTMARSGLLATARLTASSSVSSMVCASARAAVSAMAPTAAATSR